MGRLESDPLHISVDTGGPCHHMSSCGPHVFSNQLCETRVLGGYLRYPKIAKPCGQVFGSSLSAPSTGMIQPVG